MKKSEKIIIGILALALLSMIGILVFTKMDIRERVGVNVENKDIQASEKQEPKTRGKIIKVNGKLYYDTGKLSENTLRCGTMDGNITKVIEENEIPINDGEANFKGAKGYQFAAENTIEVPLDEGWVVFETKEYSFDGIIKKVEENVFFVEPNEGEQVRKSADLIMIGKLKLDSNVKFVVGEKIRITYNGMVLETYPAQIEALRYEAIENKDYTIKVYDKSSQEYNKVNKILDKSETDKYDYNIFAYKVNVNIIINGEELSLKNALLENKITMDEIIEKANQDLQDKKISGDMYRDGGSMIYKYEDYTIIKCHTLDGNRDVYIGMPDLTINDVL